MLTVEDDDDGKLGQFSARLCGGGSITAASVDPEQGCLGRAIHDGTGGRDGGADM